MKYVNKQFGIGLFCLLIFIVTHVSFSQEPQDLVNDKASLNLKIAKQIAYACETKAEELGVSVGIVVLDQVGNLKLSYLMDGQSVTSLEWAKAKALSAFEFKQATNKGEFRVWNIGEKTMVLGVAGGASLLNKDDLLGSIGVSGTKGASDDIIANAGLKEFNSILAE